MIHKPTQLMYTVSSINYSPSIQDGWILLALCIYMALTYTDFIQYSVY